MDAGADATPVGEKGKAAFVGPERYRTTLGISGVGATGPFSSASLLPARRLEAFVFMAVRQSGSKLHHRDAVSGAGQELLQQVGGFQLQRAGADAGMAGETGLLINLPVHQQLHLVLRVIHQP